MRQRELEMMLQRLEGFPEPKPELEQYMTPARISAEILYTAHAMGDIADKDIIDLGCGTGMFSIGAGLLGAGKVLGIDIDKVAIDTARRNADMLNCIPEFSVFSVEEVSGHWDTCIMNPPFGSQKRHADLPFIDKAIEVSDVVYSLHNSVTVPFLDKRAKSMGFEIAMRKTFSFTIPHMFSFHRWEKADIDVTLLRMVRA